MQKLTLRISALTALFLVTAAGWGLSVDSHSLAAPPRDDHGAGNAVEPSPHEFMEYVFQPTYRRLKKSIAADEADWGAIKSDSLILAEGGNLLLLRGPEKDRDSWIELAQQVRKTGGDLYHAAKKKDVAHSVQTADRKLQRLPPEVRSWGTHSEAVTRLSR